MDMDEVHSVEHQDCEPCLVVAVIASQRPTNRIPLKCCRRWHRALSWTLVFVSEVK